MIRYNLLLLIFSIFFVNVEKISCANILITEDLASRSHQLWNYAVADALASRGHNVTIIGPKSITLEGYKKFHNIFLEGLREAVSSVYDMDQLSKTGIIGNIFLVNEFPIFTCNYALNTSGFRSLMNYPKDFKFDLILSDITISYCLLPLSQRFNFPPTAALTACLLPPFISEVFGNDFQASYLPYDLLRFSDNMNFFERLQNYVLTMLDLFLKHNYFFPRVEEIARRVYGEDMKPFETFAQRLSLVLCNLSPGFHYSRPITPNIIPVGGLHINPNKILPQNLQQIMDDAKNGVILFSLGSNLRSDSLKPEKREAIIKAFRQLNQTVLWKFESQLDDIPGNVIISKWLPQTEILAHPNLKLFIGHGGGLSTIEAAYFGVPMIGMPFFVDQHHNVKLVVSKELGVKLEYVDLTSENLLNSIQEILRNPRYSEETKKVSRIMRDQPETPIERAVHWIEFTMRHNGTHIFDPKSRHLPSFVSSSTDVHLFLLVLLCLSIYVCYKVSLFILFLFKKNLPKTKNE